MFKNKRILITGAGGMIGLELVILLEKYLPYIADIKLGDDLRDFETCRELCKGRDIVFHLVGVKGSPTMTKEKPVDFMSTMLQCDVNMILAAQEMGVKKFLYTSSIAVENPESDKYPAWAKQTAETLIEAMRIQYPEGTEYCIVRPANVYGRFDNFKAEYPMVVTNLIRNAIRNGEVRLYNDGRDIRDIINAKDVARGMIEAMKYMPDIPVNLCTGKGVKIREIAEIIGKELKMKVTYGPKTKPTKRVMNLNWKFKPKVTLKRGIKEVIEFVNHRMPRKE